MLKHNILIALRGFRKYKGTFLINLVGLSTGLACALMIYLWVQDEISFDKFHAQEKQLYQVMELSKENGKTFVSEHTQGPLAAAMKKDLPEVASSLLLFSLANEGLYFNLRNENKSLKAAGVFAGKDLFSIFSFPLIQGNAAAVLKDKHAMVVSESLAKRLYGSADNAMGKSLEYEITGMKKPVAISGVFKDIPANSTIQFDFALTEEVLLQDLWPNGQVWTNEGPATYLLLKPGTDVEKFNIRIKDFIQRYQHSQFSLFVRPYSSSYLYGSYDDGKQSGGRIMYVKLFSFVALFILLIACINFMNLSTARASRRLKEIGVKRTLGSGRKDLVIQFITEAIFLSLFALIVAVVIVWLLLPTFNSITGKQLSLHFGAGFVASMLLVALITGLLSGSYPAFYLSGFNPVAVLKGGVKNSWGEIFARKGLVVFQFVVSLVLIAGMLVVYRQTAYIQSTNPGYSKENVLYFDKEGKVMENTDAFLNELRKTPGVLNASCIQQSVVQTGINNASTYDLSWPGKQEGTLINFVTRSVDYNLIETLGMQIQEGRSFSKEYGGDDKRMMLNETAVKVMGLKQPVGTKLRMWGEEYEVCGVVKDFHVSSLHEAIAPMVFRIDPRRTAMVMVKIATGKEKATIAALESFYKTFNPGYPFEYKFLDAAYQAQYVSEQRVEKLSGYFAGLAVLISCLGLLGLAAFNAETRSKEIGIRKVLGATVGGIMYMLTKDFLKLVLVAVLIAFPLAWWAMHSWLNSFAYRTDIHVSIFAGALALVLLLTLVIVGMQSVKAAVGNPVKRLRTE